ncbi:fumarylacetoacetate hydrolase family protein [Paenibacillus validus]|uniref:4-oxalocrotonate decarboxylase n=1 Tax=Paenibacillus validus TaxID=44253 RepID=A0A7X2Z6N2_9BACL|nr:MULTISPECIES: fumarylacetoacetate hydrolase family protein [Paenibacillus]MED4602733.1 fumarylacetoacetate hydrolase family protein [Paenibacillus validus]MED4607285.1 fumarylacetoacetate hydrolase family protein [Paenibacillus validus]MUG69343.1 4-oxalocrotonate decarboxylase [Paenibacillus validus]
MDKTVIKDLARFLINAEVEKKEVLKLTNEHPDLTVEAGYAIQEQLVHMKLEEGYRIVGPKMGLTSQAKMKQMNVNEPIYGYIFDYMVVNGQELAISDLIHPKVEAEIAFVLGKDIEGPGITGAQVLAATDYVLPALEIIDSRYQNFQFTLPDVIADNASSSRVFFGSTIKRPDNLELDLLGVTLSINGQIKDLGAGAAVVGHPANSVAMLANMLARKGLKLKAGQIILSGGITGAVMLNVGDSVSAKFDGLGTVDFIVKE